MPDRVLSVSGMLKKYIEQLIQKKDLTLHQCNNAVNDIINGANTEQIAAFLVLLHAKPETSQELYGFVRAMQSHMIVVDFNEPAIDIVGTGGDGSNSVNISTATSLLVASLDINVAKHGNRAVSSRCGSADILEAFGIATDLSALEAHSMIHHLGFTFLYAPNFHPAMQRVIAVRAALRVRTIFNLMGPLLNPVQPLHYLMGVYDPKLLEPFADVLLKLKTKRSLVVHGNGLDELNCIGPNQVIEVTPNGKKAYFIDPKDYGFNYCSLKDLQGGDVAYNKQLIMNVFKGKSGPIADTITLNAAVALTNVGFCSAIAEGVAVAHDALQNGTVLEFLRRCKNYKNTVSETNYA